MRQSGYYWVKKIGWEIGYYDCYKEAWLLTGADIEYLNGFFDEIDERQIVRN